MRRDMKVTFRADRDYYDFTCPISIRVWIEHRVTGGLSRGTPIVFEEIEGEHEAAPAIVGLKDNEATELMDSLWACGIRPTRLNSTESHLKDLQKIAFALLKKFGAPVA